MYHGEKFNALSHLGAAALVLPGAIVLVVLSALGGDPWKVVRQLLAVLPGDLARPLGRVAARRGLGAGGVRQPAGAVAAQRSTHPLGGHLRRHGPGGALYTVGIVFYALDTRLAHAHGVWHLFVVAGSGAHYVAILRYVV